MIPCFSYPVRVGAGRVKRLSPSIYLCVCVCRQKTRLFAVLLLENRHEIALYRSASQFIFIYLFISSKDAYKVGRVFCRVLWPWFLIAARPRGGIEHYGNWVCQPTTSLRERCEQTHEVGENVSKQCRSARPVRHESYVAEQRAVQYQHNQKPTTCSVLQNDGPSSCDSDSDCYKSYKAKGSTCVPSIFDQWLLWSGSRPAVIVQT